MAKHEFNINLNNYIQLFDIYSLCETWRHSDGMFDNFVSGFTAFTKIRKKLSNRGRHSGGVTVFVRTSCIDKGYITIEFMDFNDCVVLLLKGTRFSLKTDIIMCFPYISTEGSSIYNKADSTNGIKLFEDYLLQIVLKFPDAM